MTIPPSHSLPHTVVLLGGEGLRPDSSSLWDRVFEMDRNGDKSIAMVYAGEEYQELSQRERRLNTTIEALSKLGITVRMLNVTRGDLPNPSEMIYLSGSDQTSVVDSLSGTALWDAICQPERLVIIASGASVAVGERTFAPVSPYPAALDELEFDESVGLGLLPNVMILPYFSWLPDTIIQRIAKLAPALWLIGIDDQAALIVKHDRWEVAGLGTVTIFKYDTPPKIYDPGASLALPLRLSDSYD